MLALVVGGGAGQRVGETDPVTDLEQSGVDGGVCQGDLGPEQAGGPGQQDRVAQWLGRGGQGEQLGLGRELRQADGRSFARSCARWWGVGQPEASGEVALAARSGAARGAPAGCRGSR